MLVGAVHDHRVNVRGYKVFDLPLLTSTTLREGPKLLTSESTPQTCVHIGGVCLSFDKSGPDAIDVNTLAANLTHRGGPPMLTVLSSSTQPSRKYRFLSSAHESSVVTSASSLRLPAYRQRLLYSASLHTYPLCTIFLLAPRRGLSGPDPAGPPRVLFPAYARSHLLNRKVK